MLRTTPKPRDKRVAPHTDPTPQAVGHRVFLWILQTCAWYALRRAVRQMVEGRYVDPSQPERGRLSRREVDQLLRDTRRIAGELLPSAQLHTYQRLGNRQNVYLSVLTLAAYRAFCAAGIAHAHAVDLIADAGWKVYRAGVWPPRAVARLVTRDPQRQMNFILRAWLAYPFQTPGDPAAPGYQVKAWAGTDRFYTHWTVCPPQEFVRAVGTPEELEAFARIWCLYDYAVAREMAPGGRFVRPHCLSRGDSVCDMEWIASAELSSRLLYPSP